MVKISFKDSLEMVNYSSNATNQKNNKDSPPPPTPPPISRNSQQNGNYSDDTFPLPPPSIAINDDIENSDENPQQPNETPTKNDVNTIKPKPKFFFASLKSKRKLSSASATTTATTAPAIMNSDNNRNELKPDLCISNVLPSDGNSNGNRLATIRRPHNPLKCPINLENDENTTAAIESEVNYRLR